MLEILQVMTHIQGLTGGAFALKLAKLIKPDKKYLVVTKDESTAELLSGDLRLFFNQKNISKSAFESRKILSFAFF